MGDAVYQLLVALGGHGQNPPSGPKFTGDDSARGVLLLSTTSTGGGALELHGRVVAGEQTADWLIGANTDRLYRVASKALLPQFGGGASVGRPDDSCSIGGDVSASGRFALRYGNGEVATVSLQRGDVVGPVGTTRGLLPHFDGKFEPHLADRQARSTPHQAKFHPSKPFVLVPDLGCDVVWCYPYDDTTGELGSTPTWLTLPKGSGPRHLDFSPSGDHVYINCELDANVVTASFARTGAMAIVHRALALPKGLIESLPGTGEDPPWDGEGVLSPLLRGGSKGNSHIRCSADGRFVYSATRTDQSLTVFAVLDGGSTLSQIQHISCGGTCPVHFALTPSWLFCANQDSQDIVTFAIAADGSLTQYHTLKLPGSPTYIAAPFVGARDLLGVTDLTDVAVEDLSGLTRAML